MTAIASVRQHPGWKSTMRNFGSVGISARIGIAFALALPITFWALGSNTFEALDNYRRADVITRQNTAANALIAGVYEILIERQHVNNSLQADGPATPDNFRDIERHRSVARSKINAAYADLLKQDFPNKAALVAEFKSALDKAEEYRRRSDEAIRLAKAQRDPEVVKSSYAVLSAFVTAAQKLWNNVLRNTSQLDTELARLANIRVISWNMRDTAGRERATISQAMSSKSPLTATNQAFINTIRAQVGQFWDLLQTNLVDNEHPSLVKGLQSIKDGYFGRFQPLAAKMREASATGKYPMTLPEWVDVSTPLLATILDVMEGASQASEAHTAAFQAQATRSLVTNIGLLLLGVLLLIGAIAFAVITIARPMRALTAGMLELAGGNFNVALPGLGRKDEIGDVANAVETFKVKAEEKVRSEEAARAESRERLMQEFDAAVGGIVKAAQVGDFSQRVPLDDKQGTLLNLASALNTMCENFNAVVSDMDRMFGALADGDLTCRIDSEYQGAFAVLKDNANAAAERLADTIANVRLAVNEVANAATEISTSTTDLSQRTEEQAASLAETTSSMEALSATVRKNAENAQQADQLSHGASDVASRSGAVVANAVSAMSRIEESSHKIADIIGVIDEIARQTNLLALNAAVEAARAGEAGRGFSVVASEVRSLAQRSAQAAKDIKDLITNSSDQVNEGVDLVKSAGASLNEIVESIKGVAGIVSQIASASAEQASGIDQINRALAQLDETTQQNSALVEENAATAKTLEQQSSEMSERVSVFLVDAAGGRGRVTVRRAA
jgi:methyl-accepting chemotaxis protein